MRIPILALLLTIQFTRFATAEEVEIAKNAEQVLVQNGWQIAVKSEIVPGTENNRAQKFHRLVSCGKLGSGKGRVVWEERGTGTHFHPIRIAPDGTVIGVVDSKRLLILGPDDPRGKQGDGTAIVLPDQKSKSETVILHANSAGLVVHPTGYDKAVPVYFVPLDGRKPLVEKAIEFGKRNANEIWRTQTGFLVSDHWIVWEFFAFEVATQKTRKLAAETGTRKLWGIEGDLVLVQRSETVDNKAIHELVPTDMKTGVPTGRYPIAHNSQLVTTRDGIAYILTPIPLKVGESDLRAEIVAIDLARPEAPLQKKVVPYKTGHHVIVQISDKGFSIQNDPASAVEWFPRKK